MKQSATFKKHIIRLFLLIFGLIRPTQSNAQIFGFGSNENIKAQITSTGIHKQKLTAIYHPRDFKPLWKVYFDNGNMKSIIEKLTIFVNLHGLVGHEHFIQNINRLSNEAKDGYNEVLEIALTDWTITIAEDLTGEGINLSQLYVGWEFEKPAYYSLQSIEESTLNGHIIEYLNSLTPQSEDYLKLMEALSLYRGYAKNSPWGSIETGASIKPGMTDPRVPRLRERLANEGYPVPQTNDLNKEIYDEALQQVVIDYQKINGLEPDGTLGKHTLLAMNKSAHYRVDQITANMERLRHMPHNYPSRVAIVNIADASVIVLDQQKTIYEAPVIIGRSDRKTPFIDSAIRSVIFNPSWHVPAKIAREDILPKLRKDPHYLEKMGFVIKSDDPDDPHGTQVDWDQIEKDEFVFRLRQAPGELNSLGRIKFDFDNNFAVYMHGTPHEELFSKVSRNLSSGCIRLQDPETFATIVLEHNTPKWALKDVEERINRRKTHWLQVTDPLPLYIFYQTTFYKPKSNRIEFRSDVYGYDKIILDAMKARHQ